MLVGTDLNVPDARQSAKKSSMVFLLPHQLRVKRVSSTTQGVLPTFGLGKENGGGVPGVTSSLEVVH